MIVQGSVQLAASRFQPLPRELGVRQHCGENLPDSRGEAFGRRLRSGHCGGEIDLASRPQGYTGAEEESRLCSGWRGLLGLGQRALRAVVLLARKPRERQGDQ